ncbi:MAG: YraN family protein [Bacteroidetes bacterium]|nr:YraN family protein [Bacteroidota bacterium]MCL5267065.1 YraN family protein [Bacteroidota bacterium]
MSSNKVLGAKGERLAAEFLSRRGFEIVERNFRYNRGEIDLIARRGNLIVFCEVKTRKSSTYGSGEDSVDARKQAQIRKVAEGYISARNLEENEFRFDVLVVDVRDKSTRIRAIENAF